MNIPLLDAFDLLMSFHCTYCNNTYGTDLYVEGLACPSRIHAQVQDLIMRVIEDGVPSQRDPFVEHGAGI